MDLSLKNSGVLEERKIGDVIQEDLSHAIRHGILVSNLSVLVAKELKGSEEFLDEIAMSGLLHDIGKLKLSKYLYGRSKDTLLIEEMRYVRMHSTFSYEILKKEGFNNNILQAVYHHHENYDGSGYPDNLKADMIPYPARIIRVCDEFSALISVRPYRAAFDVDSAVELMIEEVKNFDMKVFLAFQRIIHSEEFEDIQPFVAKINKEPPLDIKLFEKMVLEDQFYIRQNRKDAIE